MVMLSCRENFYNKFKKYKKMTMLGYTNMEKYHMDMKHLADIILVYKYSCLLGVMQIGKCILPDIWL